MENWMTHSRAGRLALTLVPLALIVWACGSGTPASPTTTTTTQSVTETFTDTINQSGSKIHQFHTEAGTVTTTLVSIDPDASIAIGLDVGVWVASTSTCSTVLTNVSAAPGASLVGTASGALDLCVRVYDVGNIPDGGLVNYTVTVAHQQKTP
jgi:hypothetical protein